MVDLFLDSGAYSWYGNFFQHSVTKGQKLKKHINYADDVNFLKFVDDYIVFVKDNLQYLTVYANLDVIGSAEGTYKIQKYIESHGLNPMPVFHYGEDFKWLKCYIEEGYEYIGLGGVVSLATSKKLAKSFYDECFTNYICDKDGMPKVKIHGFGMTALDLMIRYPWYSVDSTSWVQTGRFGSVYVPKFRRGKYIYNENSWKVTISNRSPSQKDEGQHFSTFSKMEQEIILSYFHEKGFDIGKSEYRKENKKTYKLKENERWLNQDDADSCRELIENLGTYVPPEKLVMRDIVETIIEPGLSNDYKLRDELNIIYFLDLEKSMPKWPWPLKLKKNIGFDL